MRSLRSKWRIVISGIFGALALFLTVSGADAADASQAPDLVIGPDFAKQSLRGYLDVIRDPRHQLSFEDVAFGAEDMSFRRVRGGVAYGYTPDAFWFRLVVDYRAAPDAPLVFSFQPTFLDDIRIYIPTNPQQLSGIDYREIAIGDHASHHDVMVAPFLAAPFTFPAAGRYVIYIRVESSSSLLISGAISTFSEAKAAAIKASFIYGALILFYSTLGFVFLYFNIRMKAYVLFWFSLFLFMYALNLFSASGFNIQFNVLAKPPYSDYLSQISFLALHFFGVGFACSVVRNRDGAKVVIYLCRGLMAFIVLAMLATLLGYYNFFIKIDVVLVVVILLIFTSRNIWFGARGYRGSRIAAAACVLYACVLVPYHGALLGLIAPSPALIGAIAICNLVFIVLITISLLQRISSTEKLRRQTERLRVSRRAERSATALVRDRTEELLIAKEAAEQALRQERNAQAEQLRFVDVVTHQYRTPLAIIRSNIMAIRHTSVAADKANRKRIALIESAIGKLVEIMEVSLERGRMEGPSGAAQLKKVNLIETFEKIASHNAVLASGREIDCRFERVDSSELAEIDPDMVAIAVSNLIENAVKFSPAGTVVSMTVAREDENLVVSVEDEGRGIPEGEIASVARRYFRGSNAGNVAGTGLGLHMVTQVAAAHGGSFSIGPRPVHGVVARLILPLDRSRSDAVCG